MNEIPFVCSKFQTKKYNQQIVLIGRIFLSFFPRLFLYFQRFVKNCQSVRITYGSSTVPTPSDVLVPGASETTGRAPTEL